MRLKRGRVRIISGQWRSRVISVPVLVELRPTTDRIREVLFNWLAPYLEGARCLDVCSGSGILAFESLSRGAEHVTLLDNQCQVVTHLQHQAQLLETTHVDIVHTDALAWLSQPANTTFDIVFIDPPFACHLWTPLCQALESHGWLAPGSLIYLEMPVKQTLALPINWQALKQKSTSKVCYALWKRL